MDKTTDILQIKISKARENLPQESRNAIDSVSWKLILGGINKNYSEDQINTLQMETELLLCGLMETKDFPGELETRMKLSRAEVLLLLGEMDKLIFKKIQEDLEKRLSQKEKIVNQNRKFVFDPRFQQLPRENQEAISFSNWKEKLAETTQQFKINIEKQGLLEEITAKTLSGEIKASDYGNELKSKIELDDNETKKLVDLINEKIFKNIKEFLMSGSIKKSTAPTPPYLKKKEIPLTPVIIQEKENFKPTPSILVSNIDTKEAPIIQSFDKPKIDPYREHGIEIVEEDSLEGSAKDIYISNKNKETIKSIEERGDPSLTDVTRHSYVKPSIMANKLMNKTLSNNTVTDYSVPKISGTLHDPYHEEI